MPKLADVCTIRSKNAGPFWITVDIWFPDDASFHRWATSPELRPDAIARHVRVPAETVKQFFVPELLALKISYPRERPQGGALERDMHGGQQYVCFLDIELSPSI